MTLCPPRAVHIVDATKGPLIGDGRLRRVMPFGLTAIVSMIVAAPTTAWTRPDLAVAGSLLMVTAIITAVIFPWRLAERAGQLMPPFAFLTATLLLVSASGNGVGSPFLTLAALPVMWLAIYENRTAVIAAVLAAGIGLWLASHGPSSPPPVHGVATVVFVVCAAGMGMTLHGLVADARGLANALRDHEAALEDSVSVLDALPERVTRYRLSDHAVTYCNAAWAAQYHIEPTEAVDHPLEEFLSNDGLAGLHSQLAVLGPDHPMLVDSVARAAPNAPGRWVQWVDRYLAGADGAQVLTIGRDVTERRDAELKLAESEARFRDLADKSADVVWRFITEPTLHFDYMSPSVESILGYTASYFMEDFGRMLEIIDDAGVNAIGRALEGERVLERFDFRFRHADGSIVVGETRTTVIRGGLQGVSRDVTELRQLQASTAALALRDPLTGLANRRLFTELLNADLARTQRGGLPLVVAFLDLDGFKHVNDTLGHDAGDIVLCATADRLLALVRATDVVARVGGDEFVIVFEPNDPNSHDLIRRVDRALSAPIYITPDTTVTCPASIGIAEARTVGYDSAALLAAADAAMYEVKRARAALHDALAEQIRPKLSLTS